MPTQVRLRRFVERRYVFPNGYRANLDRCSRNPR